MVNKQAGPIPLLCFIGRQAVQRNDWLISGSIPVSLHVTNDIHQKQIYIYIYIYIYPFFFHSCTVHLHTIESFIYPTDAQLD